MRSIIDEIAQAEAQAEQIRQDAAVSARELLQKARVDAEQGLQSLNDEEREKTRLALNRRDGKAMALPTRFENSFQTRRTHSAGKLAVVLAMPSIT